jgi:hypothetical protein
MINSPGHHSTGGENMSPFRAERSAKREVEAFSIRHFGFAAARLRSVRTVKNSGARQIMAPNAR